MNVLDFCESIYYGKSIDDKLTSSDVIKWSESSFISKNRRLVPTRPKELVISKRKVKFPKLASLDQELARGKIIHFFANHELQAIEMVAFAIINFKISLVEQKKLIKTLDDEQKHLKLYINRMNELGVGFGDYPVNDFFLKWGTNSKTFIEFYCLMALTFEQANLDFAKFYEMTFLKIEDTKSSSIMTIIYNDEINHVKRGLNFINSQKNEKSLWNYYNENLPEFITPSRGKGVIFDVEARLKAGMNKEFIESMKEYSDDYSITTRKQWKK